METLPLPFQVAQLAFFFLNPSYADRPGLLLTLASGLAAGFWISRFRVSGRPLGAAYWLAGSLPLLTSALWALCRYDLAVYWWARPDRHQIYLSLQSSKEGFKFVQSGLATIHQGLFLSGLLALLILSFHAYDSGRAYARRRIENLLPS